MEYLMPIDSWVGSWALYKYPALAIGFIVVVVLFNIIYFKLLFRDKGKKRDKSEKRSKRKK
jgi:heme/copper-type cytochrome/quinol oxidase subunit 2